MNKCFNIWNAECGTQFLRSFERRTKWHKHELRQRTCCASARANHGYGQQRQLTELPARDEDCQLPGESNLCQAKGSLKTTHHTHWRLQPPAKCSFEEIQQRPVTSNALHVFNLSSFAWSLESEWQQHPKLATKKDLEENKEWASSLPYTRGLATLRPTVAILWSTAFHRSQVDRSKIVSGKHERM